MFHVREVGIDRVIMAVRNVLFQCDDKRNNS